MTTALVPTRRSTAQMRSVFMRVAMVAGQIHAAYRQLGPDRPWGFAEPGSWKCEADEDSARDARPTRGRFCTHWAHCPMGAGS